MPTVNYQYEMDKESGTYTIKDVEILKKGVWHGRGTPKGGLVVDEKMLEVALATDAEAHQYLQPGIKHQHDSEDGKTLGERIGNLGRLKRKGDALVADFIRLPAKSFEAMRNGWAGRISAEIRGNYLEPALQKTFDLAITGVAFVGGKMPAVTSLLPIATFEAPIAGHTMLLEDMIDAAPAAPSVGQVALFEMAPVPSKAGGQREKEAKMAEQAVLEAKERDLAAKTQEADAQRVKLEADQETLEKNKAAFRKQSIEGMFKQLLDAGKAAPSEEEKFMALCSAMSDQALPLYFDECLARTPDPKKTKPSGEKTPENVREPFDAGVLLAEADKLMEKDKDLTLPEALGQVELAMKEDERTMMLSEYRKENFKLLRTDGKEG